MAHPQPALLDDSHVKRRTMLKAGGVLAGAAATFGMLEALADKPLRLKAGAATTPLPDIQFAIGDFIPPAFTRNDGAGDVEVRLGPVFQNMTTARLTRTPTLADQTALANALNTIEQVFTFSPSGVFTWIAYGAPYFNRLRFGTRGGATATRLIPRLASNPTRSVLEEMVAAPTDFGQPGITKRAFNVPVRIERNDLVIILKSDSTANIQSVLGWLSGSNRLGGQSIPSPRLPIQFTSTRVIFQQPGLTRKVADQNNLSYADRINPNSPMWMGFWDQQTNAAADAATVTFAGSSVAHLTTAHAGDYFDNGSILPLSHVILDLAQFYAKAGDAAQVGEDAEDYSERVQYAFRSNPIPNPGNAADGFTNGGGPSLIPNTFQGADDALKDAQGQNDETPTPRLGHEQCLQRSSRAADGTPLHIRVDGSGFSSMDVPDGSNQPTLEFAAFVPTSDFFNTMRRNVAALDLQEQFNVDPTDNGFERFSTATRRQMFLTPPRRHRAFPLLELTSGGTGGGGGTGGTGGGGTGGGGRRRR
ncbi:MAG TPA: hypothetical protein VF995_05970 [Actinomycetota bacterium]